MCLLNMNKNESLIVDAINLDSAFKARLSAMGFCKNTPICIKNFGWFKSTVQIEVGRALIALRKDEAEHIEVHPAA
jgi:Fe2+ transport system protein FeoA